jgi:hypothetical protein
MVSAVLMSVMAAVISGDGAEKMSAEQPILIWDKLTTEGRWMEK